MVQIAVINADGSQVFSNGVRDWLTNKGYSELEVMAYTPEDFIQLVQAAQCEEDLTLPDIVVDCRVDGNANDVCGLFYEKQPRGLVVHFHKGVFLQPHVTVFIGQAVLHCSISVRHWKRGLGAVLDKYVKHFAYQGQQPNHEIYPGRL